MRKRRWLWAALTPLAVAVTVAALWPSHRSIANWMEPHPSRSDPVARSADLPADLKLMWETQPLGGTPDPTHGPNPRASTNRAINAASRVFNSVELVGRTRTELIAQLGDPGASNDSIYRWPYAFWPPPPNALVYSFTNGAYGWQFNLIFGEDGRVRTAERLWIH